MNEQIKWEKLYYPSGKLHYEGFTRFDTTRKELVPFGQGIKYFENGQEHMQGSFGDDWFIETGIEYYENGNIKFIGEYNKGSRKYYGPRYFIFGRLFYEAGHLWFEGSFHIKCSSLGYPLFENEKSFEDGIEFNFDGSIKHKYRRRSVQI